MRSLQMFRLSLVSLTALAAAAAISPRAHATPGIPYPNPHTINPTTYSFTAQATG